MNDSIRKVLFGNQKQSLRQNEAIVNFVEEYLKSKAFNNLNDRDSVITAIEKCVHDIGDAYSGGYYQQLSDKLFIQYIIGVDGYDAIVADVPCRLEKKEVGDNGKVMWYLAPYHQHEEIGVSAGNGVLHKLAENEEKYTSESYTKGMQKEDEAWELVRKILAVCPPATRAALPDDDVLAAVCFSRDYWKAML